ncbi:hypothetical protein GUITHDRAFT_133540 [Guillardia theta CCMP2712]|uniref:C2 domain-containing protein n=1 Tax=Guillardia theta (strain CCMP2712) TaxID=905079 RepID=L1JVP4_GUITC|nr:hypothetical protein GUITHDRAFT_133540 [Guillardia theta CCMP2712]EKX52452.1 hypothetical protein GUITHDRAFT_133540 [Guillardia theta CCMP2712]|eukprot:XP_005839432.1 hypothetical protein GUITHDRAFT_133540 [Guillardia theta CCMP2712]
MARVKGSMKQGLHRDCASLALIYLLLIVLSCITYRPTLAVQCWTPGDEANRPYCKEHCCSNVCMNATDLAECKKINLTSLSVSTLPPLWGCNSLVRKWCICFFEDGMCNGTTVDNIVNDTDVTSFPQESQYVNRTTLLLICLPLVFAIFMFACGVVCSTGKCRQCMGDLIWKIKPLKPKTQEEEEEDDDDDDDGGGDGEDGEEGNEMERARAKAKTLGEWTLDIIVLQARNLPRSDIPIVDKYLVGLADPYALIGVRNKRRERKTPYVPEHRTSTKKSTLNPSWNEQFRVQFSGTKDDVSVQVWDWDKWKYDDYIGEALIPTGPLVQAFKPGNTAFADAQWFELYDKNGHVVTAGKKGKELDMPAAVELQFKLDKTYDPVEALGDMKRAMEVIRATAQEEKLQKRRAEQEAIKLKKKREQRPSVYRVMETLRVDACKVRDHGESIPSFPVDAKPARITVASNRKPRKGTRKK